jgi:F0F1-type ATP synthase assembly protein I
MFGFVQWDDPLTLALEVLLSLGIVVGLIFVVRRVNAKAEADHQAAENTRTQKREHNAE